MKYSLVSFTNVESVRTLNYIKNSTIKKNFYINLIAFNKHDHLVLNLVLYFLFSPLIIFSILFIFIFKKHEEKIIVIFPGVIELIILKFFSLFKSIDIYFDFFTSFYLTLVLDRAKISNKSFAAKILIAVDKLIFKLSDFQIVETDEMKEFIKEELEIDTEHTHSLLTPRKELNIIKSKTNEIRLVFWGNFAEMHGIDFILDAAKQIKDRNIKFDLIGEGSLFKHIESRIISENIENVVLHGYLKYFDENIKSLSDIISSSTICLGTFSDNVKNNLVVPHKIIEALSFSKPVITGSTDTINRMLEGIVLTVEPKNGKDLAKKIMSIVYDENKLNEMAEKGYQYFLEKFSEESFTKNINSIMEK